MLSWKMYLLDYQNNPCQSDICMTCETYLHILNACQNHSKHCFEQWLILHRSVQTKGLPWSSCFSFPLVPDWQAPRFKSPVAVHSTNKHSGISNFAIPQKLSHNKAHTGKMHSYAKFRTAAKVLFSRSPFSARAFKMFKGVESDLVFLSKSGAC